MKPLSLPLHDILTFDAKGMRLYHDLVWSSPNLIRSLLVAYAYTKVVGRISLIYVINQNANPGQLPLTFPKGYNKLSLPRT